MCVQFYVFATPPSPELFAAELMKQLGTTRSLDGFELQDGIAVVTFDPDFVGGAYIRRVAHSFGGVAVDFVTKQPRPEVLLPFTARPWRSYGMITRLALRFGLWQPR